MNFLSKYIYNERIRKLKERLEDFKRKNGTQNQTNKLTKTKNGLPIYLVHCPLSEDEQLYAGSIYVLTTQGLDKCLNYMVVTDEYEYIKIGAIRHEMVNQGIGTQLLIFLDEKAAESGINRITAWLSPRDLDTHRERLFHFYKKNGYTITQKKIPSLNVDGIFATKCL